MNRKGFTLLEVLITSTILSIMGGSIMFFIVQSNMIMDDNVKQTFVHTNGRYTLRRLARDIREGAILEKGTITVEDDEYSDYTYDMNIRGIDGIDHNWSTVEYDENDITLTRITRDGVEIPFFGSIASPNQDNSVVLMFKPKMVGEYFFAEITFRVTVDGENKDISTVTYCRHDPTGYFDPQDYIVIQ
ncbi:MAG: prepilin-type N-terminal cleavage/methylation domain-containing protein [Candidatus Delongbacteria bacterium]|jgi:prepilin-type N-terminal cleavage/methylation domain-containing protein|nr:prepilin-type N-terminal cleavage/methylation domain-containing protein [Candidatus Delongbacteria bacterium]